MPGLYLDSCVVIYYVEQHPDYFARVDQRINQDDCTITVSDLTRLECLVHPLRAGDTVRLTRFEHFFAAADLQTVACTRAVFDRATELRARLRLKTPDALHLAAAIEAGCEEFWTNDHRLDAAAAGHLRTVTL
ncbi:MAG TPA: type II toxin-antitoxin system VapC family toxin [Rhodocyclaceae bacterium]|nr:type II toxin-antitoxin system VapC family toxin [Rhodocyclaceae bacterium]